MNLGLVLAGGRDEMAGSAGGGDGSGRGGRRCTRSRPAPGRFPETSADTNSLMTAPVLLWFRSDLRLADHVALHVATQAGPVLPVYVLDEDAAGHWAPGAASRWWLHGSLAALQAGLRRTRGASRAGARTGGGTDRTSRRGGRCRRGVRGPGGRALGSGAGGARRSPARPLRTEAASCPHRLPF